GDLQAGNVEGGLDVGVEEVLEVRRGGSEFAQRDLAIGAGFRVLEGDGDGAVEGDPRVVGDGIVLLEVDVQEADGALDAGVGEGGRNGDLDVGVVGLEEEAVRIRLACRQGADVEAGGEVEDRGDGQVEVPAGRQLHAAHRLVEVQVLLEVERARRIAEVQ